METYSSLSSSDESTISTDARNKYVCTYEGCTASFAKNSKLTYHIRRHTGERPFVCDEPNCGKTYLYSFHLRRHKDTHHGTKVIQRIVCPYEGCVLELANKYSLKKHIKIKHNPDRQYPFTCDECKQGFHRKRQLLQHSYIHNGVLPYKCDKCETRFLTQRDLNRHSRTHTNYPCSCKQTFERWSSFLEHRRICESNRFKCNVCNKTFINQSKLEIHQTRHKNEKIYNCGYDNCFRFYVYKRNLIYHINKCHKKIELPRLGCTEPNCQMSFTRMQNLQKHIDRCHSNEENTKIKKPRRPRKDKGLQKCSTSARLAGLKLPVHVHHDVIQGISVSPSSLPGNIGKHHINENHAAENISLNESSLNINNVENTISIEDNINIAKTTDIIQETSQNIVNTFKLMLKDVSTSLSNKELVNVNLSTTAKA
ncbi:hypothetical protein ILUMI_22063 [Ignelater luminosus]|uniref:C2H2-type domain-containing protein n=1 Tax=Ignelater luminosus TaxID=2038154 RepID=A0A8K0CHR9_IGNLU|nr:hypothetical protein ILUMI_22063 [Ignelater luminosus]